MGIQQTRATRQRHQRVMPDKARPPEKQKKSSRISSLLSTTQPTTLTGVTHRRLTKRCDSTTLHIFSVPILSYLQKPQAWHVGWHPARQSQRQHPLCPNLRQVSAHRVLSDGEVPELRSSAAKFRDAEEGVIPQAVWRGASCLITGEDLQEVQAQCCRIWLACKHPELVRTRHCLLAHPQATKEGIEEHSLCSSHLAKYCQVSIY